MDIIIHRAIFKKIIQRNIVNMSPGKINEL